MRVSRAKNIIGDQIGDDTILINIDTGAYYSLTPAASEVWLATDVGEATVEESLLPVAVVLVEEKLLDTIEKVTAQTADDHSIAFTKYTEMADILLADPIHEVDEDGWPKIR